MTMTCEEIESVVEEFESYIDNKPVRYGDRKLRADMRKLEALALEALDARKAGKWQPIDTAPRDRPIQLYADWPEWIPMGEWGVSVAGNNNPGNQAWVDHRTGATIKGVPTHWMPLPQPPESEVSDG